MEIKVGHLYYETKYRICYVIENLCSICVKDKFHEGVILRLHSLPDNGRTVYTVDEFKEKFEEII